MLLLSASLKLLGKLVVQPLGPLRAGGFEAFSEELRAVWASLGSLLLSSFSEHLRIATTIAEIAKATTPTDSRGQI